jgi:solute carrier family 13 (sodium-dependent dicarboxylate transporter), member 2/3/5
MAQVRFGDLSQVSPALSPAEVVFEKRRRTVGLIAGPLIFLGLLIWTPAGLAAPAARLAAIVALALVWWVTEAVPIPVTALLAPALIVVFGIAPAREVFAAFGDPVIFLFLGSFILAEAMSVHGLDRRIALSLLGLRLFAGSSTRVVVAFGILAGGLSMWLSNTATTAMLYPIALGLLAAFSRLLGKDEGSALQSTRSRLALSLVLVCAYGSSIGGVATPVGTPPNLIALGQLATLAGIHISFFDWISLAAPVSLVMLVAMLAYMRFVLPPEVPRIAGSAELVAAERRELGTWTAAQRNVVFAFGITVLLWVTPGIVGLAEGSGGTVAPTLQRLLPEGVVAVLGASLLFVLPVDWHQRRFTLTWSDAARVDWGTLMLFGGGLALGSAMFRTGLAGRLGEAVTSLTGASSPVSLTFVFTALGILITEVTSNTATATMLAPLAIAAAQAAGISPVTPTVGCAIGCSMSFMLPVSTPPNAIIYGSGHVRITQMAKAGFWLDLIAAMLVPLVVAGMVHVLGYR